MATFLFTTLPSNDLGLLARSLPIARGLSARGHEIVFSSPAKAPRMLIAEAGFENVSPKHPIYRLSQEPFGLKGIYRLFRSRPWIDEGMSALKFLVTLIRAIPLRSRKEKAMRDAWQR